MQVQVVFRPLHLPAEADPARQLRAPQFLHFPAAQRHSGEHQVLLRGGCWRGLGLDNAVAVHLLFKTVRRFASGVNRDW